MRRTFFLILLTLGMTSLRAAETTITGNSMELLDRGEEVLFTGKVKLERGTDVIKAGWMKTSKYKDKVNAKGNVELLRTMPDGEKVKAYGDEAFYNAETGQGHILGTKKKKSHVIYSQVVSATATRTLDMYAHRFDFSENTSTGTARGAVYGISPDVQTGTPYEFWSEKADLDNQKKNIHLTGETQPKVRQAIDNGSRTIVGDSIVYSYETKKFEANGRAQAVFVDIKKEETK